MTSRERFNRTMRFQSVDRVINEEFGYWEETIKRWRLEGLPKDLTYAFQGGQRDPLARFFNLDMHWHGCLAPVNISLPIPVFAGKILEENNETKVIMTETGVTLRTSKESGSIPHYIKFPVETKEDFEKIKFRYNAYSSERYPQNWAQLVKEYKPRDYPLGLNITGFFGQPREWMGFENIALAYHDRPGLIQEMCEFWADFIIETSRKVFEEVELDFVQFWEDMAFNHGSMVSPKHFREFMLPAYEKVIKFFKSFGIEVILVDCDGLTEELVPLFLEAGINGIYPIEIAAGNNPVSLRKKYGKQLRLLGGIDKRALSAGPKAIETELVNKLPYLLSAGGYIPHVDHLIPPDVSLDNYKFYLERKTRLIEKG